MRKIGLFGGLVLGALVLFWSCTDQKDNPGKEDDPLLKVSHVLKLTENIGNWDFAYIAPEGFYCYQENYSNVKESPRISTRGGGIDDVSNLSVLNWQSPDGSIHATFTMDKETKFPVKLVTDNDIFNFVFLNDSILELVHETKDGVSTMSDSIFYNRSLLIKTITAAYSNSLQQFAAYAKELLKDAMSDHRQAKTICDMIAKLINYDVVLATPDNVEFNSLELPLSPSGDYTFAVDAETWVNNYVIPQFYKISLWTGQAKFKVGGSSGSLDGSVICDASGFNEYGTYGILVDTDPANLLIDKAEYNEVGVQTDGKTSFEVNFRGFKPNTTYYYTTYFKFNTTDHGPYSFKVVSRDPEVLYADYKLFTTGDNYLSVDVVMCIDFTGSMSGIIGTVKENAMSFYEQFDSCCRKNGIELRQMRSEVIAFQDSADDVTTWLMHSPLYDMKTQQEEFNQFVGNINADDGGDIPESGLEALDIAFSKTDWCPDDGYHRQIVILWTDAPYLRVMDDYPKLDLDTIPQYEYYLYEDGHRDSVKLYEIYDYGYWDYSGDSSYYVEIWDTIPTVYFYDKYGWIYQDYFEYGKYINKYEYTTLTTEYLKAKWDAMPTGKRLILFAPRGDSYDFNGGSWDVFDDWTNVIHEGYTSSSFGDFDYILESIVGELTGKKTLSAPKRKSLTDLIKIVPSNNRYY